MTESDARKLCPYVGLEPFRERDSDFFKGRERDQRVVVANLVSAPLTILYGSAGVGKSSLLLAGVVPQLRRDRPGSPVVVFREWIREDFQRALNRACIEETWTQRETPLSKPSETAPLDEVLRACAEAARTTILVLFDQFEEYLLYHPESTGRESFEAQFARAVNREDVDVGFLISIREASVSKLDRFRERIPNLLSNSLRLKHLDVTGARAAIGQPVLDVWNERYSAGRPVTIEEKLVDEVIGQVQEGPSVGLHGGRGVARAEEPVIEAPLLQLVMTRLWKEEIEHESRTLRWATLEASGGVEEIVRAHLEDVMVELDADRQAICASFFDRLVTPTGSKVPCSAEDLAKWAGPRAGQVPATLELLSKRRILSTVPPEPDRPGETRYQIFHDVLAPAILGWRGRYVEDEKRAQAVEDERERAKARIWRRWVPLLAASTVLAALGWIYADRDSHLARANLKAFESVAAAPFDTERALELALESAEATLGWFPWRLGATPLTENALRIAIQGPRLEWTRRFEGDVTSVAYAPSGTKLAIGSSVPGGKSRLRVWDLASGQPGDERETSLAASNVGGVAFLRDEQRVVAAAGDAGWLWAPGGGEEPLFPQGLPIATAFALSADGKRVATAGGRSAQDEHDPAIKERTIKIWDLEGGRGNPFRTIDLAGAWVKGLAFSPDGCCLVATYVDRGGAQKTFAEVWSVSTGAMILTLPVDAASDTAAFDPEGRFLVIGGRDGSAHVLRPAIGRLDGILAERDHSEAKRVEEVIWSDRVLAGHIDRIRDVAVSVDGSRIATASGDRKVKVWDSETGESLLTLEGHASWVESVAFSPPDGRHLVSASLDDTVRMWSIAGHVGGVHGVAFSPDPATQTLATASGDHTAMLWDVSTSIPRLRHTLAGHTAAVYRLAFDPKGERIATASFDKAAMLWDVETGHRLHRFACHEQELRDVAFSPDGRFLATSSADGSARLYSLTDLDGRPDSDCTSVRVPHDGSLGAQVSALVFHPRERRWVTGGWDGVLRLWDFSGNAIGAIPRSAAYVESPRIVDLAFLRDGTELAALAGHTIYFWPISAFGQDRVGPTRSLSVGAKNLYCESMTFSPDEGQLAVACADGAVHVYDVGTFARTKTIAVHTDWVMGAAFSPDGSRLATASLDKTFQVSPLEFDALHALARELEITRSGARQP